MLLHPQQVTEEMYHNQLDIIQKELAPHLQRFAKLKKEKLKLNELHFYDLKAPLDPEFNPETTYDEAADTILEALQVMGPEYTDIIKRGLHDRWVDRADNVGKATGAFCSSPYGIHPYILPCSLVSPICFNLKYTGVRQSEGSPILSWNTSKNVGMLVLKAVKRTSLF